MQYISKFEPPRVALVTGGLQLGGATTFLLNFASELIRRQIPTKIFSFEVENPLASDFERHRVNIFAQNERRTIYEDRMSAILSELAAFKPTVVLANVGPASFETLRYVPEGVVRAGIFHADSEPVYVSLKNYAPHFDLAIAVSSTIKRRIEAIAEFKGIPVHRILLGVPTPSTGRLKDVNLDKPLRIIYLGRLEHEQKRVRLFPEILDQLKQSGIPFQWAIVGDGTEMNFLKMSMHTERPEQSVTILGARPYHEVPILLVAHDIYLLTSEYEGLPLSLLEAMAEGVVPVVSRLGSGIPEVVDENTGRLVDPKHPGGYAEAIIGLHQNRLEMARLSRNASERVRVEFSASAMVDRWLDVLPKGNTSNITWPMRPHVKIPLVKQNPVLFSRPARVLRRLAKKLRPK
jgi:colanic acid/amylovoran biosynthesis glycosyltransferase